MRIDEQDIRNFVNRESCNDVIKRLMKTIERELEAEITLTPRISIEKSVLMELVEQVKKLK